MCNEKREQFRQGDVLVERIGEPGLFNDFDTTPIEPDKGRVILAYGEVTGHAHALPSDKTRLYAVRDWVDRLLVVTKAAALLHEEHAPIALREGTYRVTQQREHVPGAVPARVAD